MRIGGPPAGPPGGPPEKTLVRFATRSCASLWGGVARYEIVDVRTGQVVARHRTRQAVLDGWRIDHAGVAVRLDRTYRDGTRRAMVDGTWHFADDVHDTAPAPSPGPVPRPVDELLTALRRVASLVEEPLTSAAYHRLHDPSEPGARTIGERFGTWAGALNAAGLPPTGCASSRHRGRRRHWTDDEILQVVGVWLDGSQDRRHAATYSAAAAEDADLCGNQSARSSLRRVAQRPRRHRRGVGSQRLRSVAPVNVVKVAGGAIAGDRGNEEPQRSTRLYAQSVASMRSDPRS